MDIAAFEKAVAAATTALETGQVNVARTAYAKAVDLYGGDLLPACYEEWLLSERERLRQSFLDALERLVVLCEDERDYSSAIHYAQRLLRADPLHEETYRRLMWLHTLNGDRAGALRIYHVCATTLSRELGVEPNQDTQEAYARLLNMETPRVLRTRPVKPFAAGARLVGRQPEWAKLRQVWETVRRGRMHLACLVGEAGIGKTRLVEELIGWARHQGVGHARAYAYVAGSLAYAPVTAWLRSDAFESARKRLPDIWRSEVTRLLQGDGVADNDDPSAVAPPAGKEWQIDPPHLNSAVCAGALPLFSSHRYHLDHDLRRFSEMSIGGQQYAALLPCTRCDPKVIRRNRSPD